MNTVCNAYLRIWIRCEFSPKIHFLGQLHDGYSTFAADLEMRGSRWL